MTHVQMATNAVKKIMTVRNGVYDGTWLGKFCWLVDENKKAFYRFDVKHNRKKSVAVTVTITGVKAIVVVKNP